MPGKRKFEEQIAALDALRQEPPESQITGLRKALENRNNFVVGKAADLVRELKFEHMAPDLLAAFERFFDNPGKTDPQCWAKNALSRALATVQHQDADVFLRGMRHIQMEPVWGGQSDTAGTLRATCAFALVQCRSLTEADLLAHLIDLIGDKDKVVRSEVIRAVEQIGSPSASLVLRARAILGSDEPEVLGACYSAILGIEGVRVIPWMRRFLLSADDAAGEAALAIAGTHSNEGFECLQQCLSSATDPWWRSVLLSAIALTRQDSAVEFLLDLVAKDSLDAQPAMDAIFRALPSSVVIERLGTLVAGNRRLARHFAQLKNSSQ
jgi:HEAT repeat protein